MGRAIWLGRVASHVLLYRKHIFSSLLSQREARWDSRASCRRALLHVPISCRLIWGGKQLTWEEIKRQYPDEWVLIDFSELDTTLQVVQGDVIAHSPRKADIDKKLLELENERIAIEFTGEMPEEPAYLLWSSII